LIPHKEVNIDLKDKNVYKVLKPNEITFTNYPYEWSFSQFKDAALLTLNILKMSLKDGFVLKDATPFNIMFEHNKPIFIDTLSFEIRKDSAPWVAYRQFCEMFLGPLLLASKIDTLFISMLVSNIDGYSLDFVKNTLGHKNFTNLGALTHIYLHSQSGNYFRSNKKSTSEKNIKVDTNSLMALTENLESLIKSLKYKSNKGFWENYYEKTNYNQRALKEKTLITKKWLKKVKPNSIIDLGSNDGTLISDFMPYCDNYMCIDNDHDSLEKLYKSTMNKNNKILSLYQDLSKTSLSVGFMGQEREAFLNRADFDCVLALALIHHLSIRNNLSFEQTANLMSKMGKYLIIEFIPKEDSNVQLMLKNKKDIYKEYSIEYFETVYSKKYKILDKIHIKGSKRIMFLMKKI
jgi:hypothetical protein